MEFDVTREQWAERFALHLSKLEIAAEPDQFIALANRLWESLGHLDPETAADDEFASRLRAGAGTGSVVRAFEPESDFERTQRIPVERLNASGEYVRDNDEWIARCLARVLELDPIIRNDEARRSITELAALERWRLMNPEAAAEQLYTPIRPQN